MKQLRSPYLIGIAGPSCSGKTILSEKLADNLKDFETIIISLDSYYIDLSHLELDERHRQNFDTPNLIDFGLLYRHLRMLKENLPVEKPIYDFVTHTRTTKTLTVLPSAMIIIEGILTLHSSEIRQLLDASIYIDIDFDTALKRRIARDIKTRGRSRQSVEKQFKESVIPMAQEFILPSARFADIIVSGTDEVEISAKKITEFILGLW